MGKSYRRYGIIVIRTIQGRRIWLNYVCNSDTIASIKDSIHVLVGIHPSQQCLIYVRTDNRQSRRLEDSRTLSSYKIIKESTRGPLGGGDKYNTLYLIPPY